MSNAQTFDPSTVIPIEAIIGAPLQFVVNSWEAHPPASKVDCELFTRASAIFEVVASLTSTTSLDNLKNAVFSQDLRAIMALSKLRDCLNMTCDTLIQRGKKIEKIRSGQF